MSALVRRNRGRVRVTARDLRKASSHPCAPIYTGGPSFISRTYGRNGVGAARISFPP